ncbi:MAG: hypothetical protein O3B24_08615, partial [Verrucomicrobia bacterium]|nr:hypothetical protein [Verrucomicrobiota bacterium]
KSQDAQDGLSWLSRASCDWATPWGGNNPIYHWYYITQAKFHAGGETWTSWNKQFSPSLVRNQTVIPSAIADTTGKLVDIGYWKAASQAEQSQSYVYNTALCALMLQVYYRYLPTFKTVEDVEAAPAPLTSETGEVDIQVM